jgi:uncharacterized damage-inducible protein DinB
MSQPLTIPEIEERLYEASRSFYEYCSGISNEQFFRLREGKWSAAQQVKHLVKSTDTARLAFTLPKFIIRWIGGRPNRDSRTYDELVAKYKLKLEQGGKASRRYIPKPILAVYGKEKLLQQFNQAMEKHAKALKNNWKEDQPDRYLAPHPLLGKITLRELCYFTIHHAEHHLNSIRIMISGDFSPETPLVEAW